MTEKIVLPTAEDMKAEKTHQGLIQGVESFTPDKLKPAKTREPASGSDGIHCVSKVFDHLPLYAIKLS